MVMKNSATVMITAPKMETAEFKLKGTAPLMVHRFAQKAVIQIRTKQEAGEVAKKGAAREARDFEKDYEAAKYIAREGWLGMNAASFRNAMISACKVVGFQMTRAKLAVFIEADGYDKLDGTPLVRIKGRDQMDVRPARNDNGGMDLRSRPLWPEWEIALRVRYDSAMFSLEDITNLLARVGMQVGIGEGRPDSKKSAGMGFGLFSISGGRK
jgi:hypothetical protein